MRRRISASSAYTTTRGGSLSPKTASMPEMVPSNTIRWAVGGPRLTWMLLPKSTVAPSRYSMADGGPVAPGSHREKVRLQGAQPLAALCDLQPDAVAGKVAHQLAVDGKHGETIASRGSVIEALGRGAPLEHFSVAPQFAPALLRRSGSLLRGPLGRCARIGRRCDIRMQFTDVYTHNSPP